MKVLIIEDEEGVASFLKKGLEAQSWVVDVANDGEKGLSMALLNDYQVVLTDIYLPKKNGIFVAQKIKEKKKDLPIISLTVETEIATKVKMLSLCDDYVTKPFLIEELVARIKAVRRRVNKDNYQEILQEGDLILDSTRFKVSKFKKEVKLNNKEFSLLEYFMRNRDVILSRSMILENVWDIHADPFTNTIEVHIKRLRNKIETKNKEKFIHTVPKKGYIFKFMKD